jgi:hypothetical protein
MLQNDNYNISTTCGVRDLTKSEDVKKQTINPMIKHFREKIQISYEFYSIQNNQSSVSWKVFQFLQNREEIIQNCVMFRMVLFTV